MYYRDFQRRIIHLKALKCFGFACLVVELACNLLAAVASSAGAVGCSLGTEVPFTGIAMAAGAVGTAVVVDRTLLVAEYAWETVVAVVAGIAWEMQVLGEGLLL